MDEKNLKSVEMRIRVTPEQKGKIMIKANKARMTVSAYLLQTSLCKASPLTQAELEILRYRLDENGRKINSIVRFFNTYAVIDNGEAEETLEVWEAVQRDLNKVFAWIDEPEPHPPREPALKSRRGEKTDDLHLRVTADLRQRIHTKAARAEVSVSRFVLMAALKRTPPLDKLLTAQTYVSLMRIGNNLSQAVKYLNKHSLYDYTYLNKQFIDESERFRRAFGWDYALEQEETEDGLC